MYTSSYFASSYFAPRYFANNLYSPVGKSVQHLWNVKAVVGDANDLLWNISTVVGVADQFLWNTKSVVSDNIEYVWNTFEILRANNQVSLLWDTLENVPVPLSNDLTCYVYGHDVCSSAFNLYIRGTNEDELATDDYTSRLGTTKSRFSNFVLGLNEFNTTGNKSLTLFIRGTTLPGNMFSGYDPLFPLYENGHDTASLHTTLFIGETPNKSLNLFMRGEDPFTETSSLDLFVHGSMSENGMFSGINLHIYSDIDGNKQEGSIPLFLQAATESSDDRTLNLWIYGEAHTASASLDLYIQNNQLGASSSVTLFIQGEGTTEGATPIESTLNLWLQRDPTAMLNLYISGPGEVISQDMTLFIEGSIEQTSSVNLSIPNVLGYAESKVVLYTHGF